MKPCSLLFVGVGTLVLVTAALSGPLNPKPVESVPIEQAARVALHQQVLNLIVPMRVRFSRASPSKEYRFETEFDPQTLVDGEVCIPFRIKGGGKDSEVPSLLGYYRQSDKLILLLDDKTKRYVAASEHPVVKAGKRNPSGIHLFPIQLGPINSGKAKLPKLEPPL